MLVMVLDGTFHKTYGIGLLGNVPQNKRITRFFIRGFFLNQFIISILFIIIDG